MTDLDKRIEGLAEGFVMFHSIAENLPGRDAKEVFIAGANAARELMQEKLDIALEAIKDVIRNSPDIIAKKRCSEALREIQGEK